MSIHVASHAESLGRTFPDATSWQVDGDGYLHIIKDTEGIAVFRPVSWDSVERVQPFVGEDSDGAANTDGKTDESKDTPPAK